MNIPLCQASESIVLRSMNTSMFRSFDAMCFKIHTLNNFAKGTSLYNNIIITKYHT